MDTRSKVVSYEDAVKALAGKQFRWVTGYFDPLLAEHARRLHDLVAPGQLLAVIVANSDTPLLPQRARAELVAALADVDLVVMKEGVNPSDLEDDRITRDFVQRIVSKHEGASH